MRPLYTTLGGFGIHFRECNNLEDFDLAFFAMSAHEGLDQEILKWWEAASELSLPRALLITKIEDEQADFDEAILKKIKLPSN